MIKKIFSLLALLLSFSFVVSCTPISNEQADSKLKATLEFAGEDMVIVYVTESAEGCTAFDLLNLLKSEGKLDFESFDGGYGAYVTSINGKSEFSNGNEGYSWMLYTTDTQYSSDEFGSFSYQDKKFAQSAFGATMLNVVEGEYYAWRYDRWAF